MAGAGSGRKRVIVGKKIGPSGSGVYGKRIARSPYQQSEKGCASGGESIRGEKARADGRPRSCVGLQPAQIDPHAGSGCAAASSFDAEDASAVDMRRREAQTRCRGARVGRAPRTRMSPHRRGRWPPAARSEAAAGMRSNSAVSTFNAVESRLIRCPWVAGTTRLRPAARPPYAIGTAGRGVQAPTTPPVPPSEGDAAGRRAISPGPGDDDKKDYAWRGRIGKFRQLAQDKSRCTWSSGSTTIAAAPRSARGQWLIANNRMRPKRRERAGRRRRGIPSGNAAMARTKPSASPARSTSCTPRAAPSGTSSACSSAATTSRVHLRRRCSCCAFPIT